MPLYSKNCVLLIVRICRSLEEGNENSSGKLSRSASTMVRALATTISPMIDRRLYSQDKKKIWTKEQVISKQKSRKR